MAVFNYNQVCGYSIGELKNTIYLYPFNEAIASYVLDSTEYSTNGYCESIKGKAVSLYADDVVLSSESDSNNRYTFSNKLTLKLLERNGMTNFNVIQYLMNNKLLVVFEDKQSRKWVLNPEFPITITYDYNITDTQGNIANITLLSESNIPTLLYIGDIAKDKSIRSNDCKYNVGKVKSLQLGSIYKVFFKELNNTIEVIEKGEGLKDIEFNRGSLTFKEEFNGSDFIQTLNFNIPFSDYKYYFHYDLLEYIDNKYYALIKTSNDNLIIGGNRQGMFPEYKISTSDQGNIINIILTSSYKNGNILISDDSSEVVVPDDTYIKLFGECINDVFTYTLIQKVNNGTPTNDYYCLKGYSEKYKDYNIVGTYNANDTIYGISLTDFSIDCASTCNIEGLPTSVQFTKKNEAQSFNVITDCDLTFEYRDTDCNVSFIDGVLTITNKIPNGSYVIKVHGSDGSVRNIIVYVNSGDNLERTINITAKAQNVDVILSFPIADIQKIETDLIYNQNQNGTGYLFTVSENESTTNIRTFDVKITYLNGTTELIHIIQDKLYSLLVDDGTLQCFGNDSYKMLLQKVGYTPEKIDINKGYVKGELYEKDSKDCIDFDEKVIVGTICIDHILYNKVEYKKNGVVITTKLEYEGSACDTPIPDTQKKWIVNKEKSVCVNDVAYYVEELWVSDNGTDWYLVTPIQERPSKEVAPDSNACEIIPPKPDTKYRWYWKGDTYCVKGTQNINCENNEVVKPVPGDKTTFLCDGTNKFEMIKKSISPLCDGNYTFFGYEKGRLLEENSKDCGGDDGGDTPVLDGDLVFEFDGDNYKYNINNTSYVADKSPYSVKMADLGITNIESIVFIDKEAESSYISNIIKLPDLSKIKKMKMIYSVNPYTNYLIGINYKNQNTSSVKDFKDMLSTCVNLSSVDLSNIDTNAATDLSFMFNECKSLKKIDVSNFITTNVTTMESMFSGCEAIDSLDLNSFNTANVTVMESMFSGCKRLKALDVSNFNTNKVKRMAFMFAYCKWAENINLGNFNTSAAYDMRGMFQGCEHLKEINLATFNTSKCQLMGAMFQDCRSLTNINVSNFNTTNVMDLNDMFRGCELLSNINLSNFNTTNTGNIRQMFDGCSSLTELDLSNFNTTNISDTFGVFQNCTKLGTLKLNGWNLQNIDQSYGCNMFMYDKNLKTIYAKGCSNHTINVLRKNLEEAGLDKQVNIIS